MSVNHAKEFFEYISYPKTFLTEGHMASIVLFLKKKDLKFEIYIIFNIYFQKMGEATWVSENGIALLVKNTAPCRFANCYDTYKNTKKDKNMQKCPASVHSRKTKKKAFF